MWVNKHGRVDDGFVVVTTAGKLPCKHVFHSVGPIWRGGNEGEEIILGMAVRGCLEKAQEMKLTSISLPAISSGINSESRSLFILDFLGIFGFPKDLCAKIMFEITIAFIKENKGTTINQVRFTNFDDKTVDLFDKECTKLKAQYSS